MPLLLQAGKLSLLLLLSEQDTLFSSLTTSYEVLNWYCAIFRCCGSVVMTLCRHVTLMTISVALVATASNIFAARRLPMFEGVILYLHILLWFGVGALFFPSYSIRTDLCSSISRSGSLPLRYQLLKSSVTSRTGVDGQPWAQQ
jgi:hypothetical protein